MLEMKIILESLKNRVMVIDRIDVDRAKIDADTYSTFDVLMKVEADFQFHNGHELVAILENGHQIITYPIINDEMDMTIVKMRKTS